jgi:hypothetical protein
MGGSVGLTAGPEVAYFDRVEWLILDPLSAMAALRSGEIEWWKAPLHDQAEALARDRDITVVSEYATAMGILRFNQLHPPFNNVAVAAGAARRGRSVDAEVTSLKAVLYLRAVRGGRGDTLINVADRAGTGRCRYYPRFLQIQGIIIPKRANPRSPISRCCFLHSFRLLDNVAPVCRIAPDRPLPIVPPSIVEGA